MEFLVLGPVEAYAGGKRVGLGHARQRAVLAVLVLELGRVVPAEFLVDRVWGDDPPPTVRNALHGNVARLRAVIAAAAEPGTELARRGGGYVLEAAREKADVLQFRQLVKEAAASDDERADLLLRQAVELWRGAALSGLESPWLDAVREGLERERRAAVLDLRDVGLRLGRHSSLVPELSEAAAVHPADERLAGQLMLALYRSGQAAEALRWFERVRRELAEELGTDPGSGLRLLHQQILRSDPELDWPGAAGPGVALRSGAVAEGGPLVPQELPRDVPAFTGRAAELAQLDQLLAPDGEGAGPVVISAVSGTAGVGKTALAVRWAHRAARWFPDGRLYVDLRGYDPDRPLSAADALAAFLRSLGLPGQDIPAGESERAARYRSLLASRRVLVVLDNAADVTQVRPLLPGGPGCRVVVTSRDALAGLVARDGARRLDLDLLPERDAIGLLRAVIGPRADEDGQAARLLAQRCGRLPLALRVAAELAVARPGLALAELARELADEQHRLDLLDAGGDQRTAVRAVLSWSCQHLDDATVRGFALLGLHPGPDLDTYAAAALTGTGVSVARRLLDALVRAHLVQPSAPGRYRMHDLLRAYARDLAASGGGKERQEALTRLLDHYLATVIASVSILYPAERSTLPDMPLSAAPGPPIAEPGAARAWLDDQLPCLVAATASAAAGGWPSHVLDLASALFRHLDLGRYAEASTINAYALSAARKAGDRAAEARALTRLGAAANRQGRFQEAVCHLEQALALARESGDRVTQAAALTNLGNVAGHQGHYEEASGRYQEALALQREAGDRIAEASNLVNLSGVVIRQGGYQQAAGYLEQALAVARDTGHRVAEVNALGLLGEAETAQGRHDQAARYLRQCLAAARKLDDRIGMANALSSLGRAEFRRGRQPEAAGLLQQALTLHREIGDRPGEAQVLNHLGQLCRAAGQSRDARAQHAAALDLALRIGDSHEQASAHDGLASVCDAAGDHVQARGHWQEALAIYTSIGAPEAEQVRAQLDRAACRGPGTDASASAEAE
jgi:DNA-binding SARP family transcriptional activator/Flp pilus assembly protein TadD